MKTKEFKDKILSLSDRIFPMVVRLLDNEENARDAVQEIMTKLWDRCKKVGNHPNIPGFVFLTARNHCLDLLKKKNPDFNSSDFQLKTIESESRHCPVEWEELNTIIENLLKELPAQQRDIMLVRDIDVLEFTEISIITNLKVVHILYYQEHANK